MVDDAEIWDGLASRYDTIVRLFDGSYPAVCERLARDLPTDARVLEIAAGTGQFTLHLGRLAAHLLATDISPEMVERLRQRVAASALSDVECTVMSAYELDLPNESFDAVFCANALHVMDQPKQALAEFRRVLRRDGVFLSATFLHGVDGLRRGVSRALSLVSPFVAHTRFDMETLECAITDAGFDILASERLPGLFPIGYVLARPIVRSGFPQGDLHDAS